MKRKFFLAVCSAFALTVLCACKDGTGDGAISSGRFATNSIVVGITQDLDSLDPHIAVAAGTDEVLFNVFEGLVKPDKDGNFVEAVAESYVISEDATLYTFTLRENVKFHNGKTVTAEDVVYSLKRCAGLLDVQDPNVLVESALSVINEIVATDERTVVLRLLQPNTELLPYLTCAIIPCDYEDQKTHPVGTGPFQFVSYAPLESFVVERFEDYYGAKAHLNQVVFKIYANTDAAFLELMAGSIDIFPYLTQEQADQLSGKYNIEVGSMNMVQAMFLNNKVKPFDDAKVRQAVCYAIDKQEILAMLSGGRGNIIGSNMFPGLSVYYNEEPEGEYPYNPELAKKLLQEAGYDRGFSFEITVPSNYQYHMDTAQVIVEQLKEVGITVTIKPVEWATWLSEVYSGRDYQATIIGLDSNLAPSDILKRYVSTAKNNFINYESERFDTIFEQAVNTVSTEEKIVLYHELQQMLADEAASVYLQDPALLTAVNKGLCGYEFYPVFAQDMSLVYYEKSNQ